MVRVLFEVLLVVWLLGLTWKVFRPQPKPDLRAMLRSYVAERLATRGDLQGGRAGLQARLEAIAERKARAS